MLVFIFIVILILNLLAIPIRIALRGEVDFFGNDGFIKVYVFGIRVLKAKIFFEHESDAQNSLILQHGKKSDSIHLNNNPEDKKSVVAIMKNPAFREFNIKQLSVDFLLGHNGNAFFTTMMLAAIKTVTFSAFAFLKSRFGTRVNQTFTPVYNQDILQSEFSGIISISVANIISSLIRSGLAKKNKNKRRSSFVHEK